MTTGTQIPSYKLPRNPSLSSPALTAAPVRRSIFSASRLAIALVLLTVVLYGHGFTRSVGEYGDSFHHLMNGIFLHDALLDFPTAIRQPREFALSYYRYYPAVSLGYYPPGFAAISGVLMLLFGVSGATGQLTVLLSAIALTLFAFGWFRLRFEPLWAAAGTFLLMTTPLVLLWGRDIMLEVPALALMTGAMWSFERLLRTERPTWRMALGWAALSALAFWTRQHTIMLLGVYLLATLATGRWRQLRHPPVVAGMLLVISAAAGLLLMTFKLGGDNVGHTVGFTTAHAVARFNKDQWLSYLHWLPRQLGWPILAAALVGAVFVIVRREPFSAIVLIWIVLFYIIHSYFKAQDRRYAVLWLPPFIALALYGLWSLRLWLAPRDPVAGRRSVGAVLGGSALLVLMGYSMTRAAGVGMPYVSDAYQRAAEDLRDVLPPYTCLAFLPDRPGRPAVCYRLAVEERLELGRDIYSFGRIARANQVLDDWPHYWSDFASLDRSLKEWNIKYIMTETPRPLDLGVGDDVIERAVDGVLKLGDFKMIRHYDVRVPGHHFDRRTLVLYERISPMEFHPGALPPIRTNRIPIDVVSHVAASQP